MKFKQTVLRLFECDLSANDGELSELSCGASHQARQTPKEDEILRFHIIFVHDDRCKHGCDSGSRMRLLDQGGQSLDG